MKLFNIFKSKTTSNRKKIESNSIHKSGENLDIAILKFPYYPTTTLENVLDFIKDNSKQLGIELNDCTSGITIKEFEKKKTMLPDDFKLLYKFSNGFETAHDLFRLIPLEEIISNKKDKHLISDNSFHFTEYMIYSDMWTVDINPEDKNDYKIYNKADDVVFLTNSIAEFLVMFINKGIYDGLYEWREKIKNVDK